MDDDVAILKVLSRILAKFVAGVVTCQSTEEAIELYWQEQQNGRRFDLTILDLTIPGGAGGKDAGGKILELDPAAILVCSSGYTDDHVMANYRDYGFQGAIAKPYTIEMVGRVIRSLEKPTWQEEPGQPV